MNEKDQNFDRLKRLLKLKQQEVPPPGYFNHFSSDVIARIRAGEAGGNQAFAGRAQTGASWFAGFMGFFETRPGLVGGFATSLCLLLVFGVFFAERSEQASDNMLMIPGTSALPAASAVALNSSTLASAALPASVPTGIVASTNPVTSLQPVATLFGQPGASPLFQPASFAPATQ